MIRSRGGDALGVSGGCWVHAAGAAAGVNWASARSPAPGVAILLLFPWKGKLCHGGGEGAAVPPVLEPSSLPQP